MSLNEPLLVKADENQRLEHQENTLEHSAADGSLTFWNGFFRVSKVAIPMALSYTFSFEVFASGILAGNYNNDEDHTAAITLMSTFMNTLMITGFSPLFAMAVVASNWLGDLRTYLKSAAIDSVELERKRVKIAAVNRAGMLISAFTTPPIFLLLFFSKSIAHNVFHQDEVVSEIAQEYLRPYAFAVPGVMLRICFEQMMFTMERAKHAMYIGLATFSIGTVISYWLGFGGLGVREKGLQGIALGYVIESWLIALCYGVYISKAPGCRDFPFFNFKKMTQANSEGVLSTVLSWSWPISVTIVNELLMTFVVGLLAGNLGTKEQASMTFDLQLVYLLFIAYAAFGIASQQEVGREIGAKCYKDAYTLIRSSISTGLIWMLPFTVFCSAYPKILRDILGNHDDKIVHMTNVLTPIIATGALCDVGRYSVLQVLRSLADPWGSTGYSTAGLWFGLLLSGLLGNFTNLGVYGIGAGYAIGMGVALVALLCRLKARSRVEYIKTVNDKIGSQPTLVQFIGDGMRSAAGFFTSKCCKSNEPSGGAFSDEDARDGVRLHGFSGGQ